MLVVGLMSGTSLDGVDATLVSIYGYGEATKINIIKSISIPYDNVTKEELLQVMNFTSNVEQICSLHYKLSDLFATAVKKVCQLSQVPIDQIDLIGSHGQTIYHLPNAHSPLVRSTLQIGEPAILAYKTNAMVVSNFRAMDLAAGGEGAPLIPYIDWLLFRNEKKGRILQNIGGIGNCTVLQAGCQKEDVYAFDTGPGNMIIDELCRTLKNIPYDLDGKVAAAGKVITELVDEWMRHRYFQLSPPKSTGREEFGRSYTMGLLDKYTDITADDLIATATYFTACSIASAYQEYIFPKTAIEEVIISGGGGNNPTLLAMIQSLLPHQKVITINEFGMTTDEKEAVGFAILANEYIHQQKTNMPGATGAKKAVLLGQLTLPPNGDHRKVLQRTGLV